jgi:G3E family GTPase
MPDIFIVLLTGFLGSGKTTLLNEALRHPALADTVVLVNEFGEIGIDNDLLKGSEAGLIVASNGCICCQAAADLIDSLDDIVARMATGMIPVPQRLIIETTGLADPVPLVHQLLKLCDRMYYDSPETGPVRFTLGRVITTVDTITGQFSLETRLECLKQAALADTLVLTKTDLPADPLSRREFDELKAELAAINPAACIVDRSSPGFSIGALFSDDGYDPDVLGPEASGWLAAEAFLPERGHDSAESLVGAHEGAIQSHCFRWTGPVRHAELQLFLERICFKFGVKLLRLKGIVAMEGEPDRPVAVHVVRWTASPIARLDRWPSEDRSSCLVLITEGLSRSELEPLVEEMQEPAAGLHTEILTGAGIGLLIFAIVAGIIGLALHWLEAHHLFPTIASLI